MPVFSFTMTPELAEAIRRHDAAQLQEIATLVRRARYRGGRKARRAAKRLRAMRAP